MKMTNARMAHRKQHGALTTLLVSQNTTISSSASSERSGRSIDILPSGSVFGISTAGSLPTSIALVAIG